MFKKYVKVLIIFLFPILVLAKDVQPLSNAIGIYVSPKGQEYFQNNLKDFLLRNGINLEEAFFNEIEIQLDEMRTIDLVPEEDEVLRAHITRVKEVLKRYFMGADFDKHRFNFMLKELAIKLELSKLGVDFKKPDYESELSDVNNKVDINFNVQAANAQTTLKRVELMDKNYPFLGKVAVNDILFGFLQGSDPFDMSVSTGIFKDPSGGAQFKINKFQTNVEFIKLGSTFTPPIEMPEVELRINDYRIRLNLENIEQDLIKLIPQALKLVQAGFNQYLNETLAQTFEELVNQQLSLSLKAKNEMSPPGAPTGSNPPPFQWGVDFDELTFHGDLLHLNLGAFAFDPTRNGDNQVPSYNRAHGKPSIDESRAEKHDVLVTLNQGFVNKILMLSNDRGYFRNMRSGKEVISLSKVPVLDLKKNLRHNKLATVRLEVEKRITGWQARLVNNPVRINFDVNVLIGKSPKGHHQILFHSLDEKTIHIDDKYIRVMPGVIKPIAKKIVKKIAGDLTGTVLVDKLPVPDKFLGVPIIPQDVILDRNGHLKVYLDYGLEENARVANQ